MLVHGGWADASSWDNVIAILQHEGYTVDAPPNPLRGLASDSAYLASYLSTISGPIVLVGHSYGGAVITNAAYGNTNVKALVYVDAFEPAQGETLEQLTFSRPGSCLTGGGNLNNVFNFVVDPSQPAGDYDLYLKIAPGTDYAGLRRLLRHRRTAHAKRRSSELFSAPLPWARSRHRQDLRPGRPSRLGRSSAPRTRRSLRPS